MNYEHTSFKNELDDKESASELDYFLDFYEWSITKYPDGKYNIKDEQCNTFDFEENTTLRKPDSSDTCQLNKTWKLKGVYNINRGYAVFRQVQILCESDEYYIVQSGDDYGLSNYDHIALTGKDVHEGDVIS